MAGNRKMRLCKCKSSRWWKNYEALTTGQRGTKMSPSQAGQEVVKRTESRYDSLVVGGFKKAFGGEATAAGA
jgi:hypothetical protein